MKDFQSIIFRILLLWSFCERILCDPMSASSYRHQEYFKLQKKGGDGQNQGVHRRDEQQLPLPLSEGLLYGRRHPHDPPVDYGDAHPYELMEKRRKLGGKKSPNRSKGRHLYKNYWYDESFAVD
eukprot:CAMPEP_0197254760 /NCGR_PEP_ID=MMETSP1429-20130617/69761_1 /TAXON_ID=49237 /ORGANISM="Chaetoceros  sp., Strain UNC1202" /LENGTH=123 /DNA_ID=CAMNT_0042717853 /DNA_START=1 /DNA_END=369 /DNA_ORIENTATION=-